MWHLFIIALVVLIAFGVWGIFAYLKFWLMLILNIPIIALIGLKAQAEMHNKKCLERYRDSAIIALVITLAVYLLKINLPFLLITDFMLITFAIVKGIDFWEYYSLHKAALRSDITDLKQKTEKKISAFYGSVFKKYNRGH